MRQAPQLVEQEFQLYHAHQKELEAKLSVSRQQTEQVKQELAELEARERQLARSYALVSEELDLTKPLVAQGAVSEVELLRLRRTVNDIKGELESTGISIEKARAKLEEAESHAEQVQLDFRNSAREELNQTMTELERLGETNVALEDRVKRTRVRSPMRGTVKQVLVNTIGGVVSPGQKLVEIVPLEDTLLIEARIKPADIAFLHPGLPAMVKFTAYDFARYGGMEAKLEHISADTITDEKGNEYYLVRVRTREREFRRQGETLPIIPGMTTTVDIITGKKTVLEYLLKPILRAKESALSER
jgi:adhesin transport system membrane fusion protein